MLEHAGAACVIGNRGSFGASQLPVAQPGVVCVLHFQIQGRSSGFFPRHHMFPPFCFSTCCYTSNQTISSSLPSNQKARVAFSPCSASDRIIRAQQHSRFHFNPLTVSYSLSAT